VKEVQSLKGLLSQLNEKVLSNKKNVLIYETENRKLHQVYMYELIKSFRLSLYSLIYMKILLKIGIGKCKTNE